LCCVIQTRFSAGFQDRQRPNLIRFFRYEENKIKAKNIFRIIRSTTPLRINDIGGWTDTWFSGWGNVLNLAVTPAVKVRINVSENKAKQEKRVLVRAENFGDTFRVNPDRPDYKTHPLLQGALNSLPIPEDIDLDIRIHSETPAGSSTGTSASVCVALLGGLDRLTPEQHSLDEIVSLAHRVETEKLKLQSGIQDQICAAYGGVCFIRMERYPRSDTEKLDLGSQVRGEMDRRLCLIFLGEPHSSTALHEEVITLLAKKGTQFKMIEKMRMLAARGRDFLLEGDLDSYGQVMIQNNECQRSLHPELIPEEADLVIQAAKKYHAAGWKVNGAGGKGGSITILSSPEESLKRRMLEEIDTLGIGIKSIPVSLSHSGLTVEENLPNRNSSS
jgi:D-glycero-alpha-D-manno-heptose-7-phosphate kinase